MYSLTDQFSLLSILMALLSQLRCQRQLLISCLPAALNSLINDCRATYSEESTTQTSYFTKFGDQGWRSYRGYRGALAPLKFAEGVLRLLIKVTTSVNIATVDS